MEAVAADVSDRSKRRPNEGAGLCTVGCEWSYRSEEPAAARGGIEGTYTTVDPLVRSVGVCIGTTLAGRSRAARVAVTVLVGATFVVGRCEGKAALVGRRTG